MTVTDAINIIAGGKGAATEYLKTKTKTKLTSAVEVEVKNQLDSNGLSSLIDKANTGKNIVSAIGSILGKNTNSSALNGTQISQSIEGYASEQIVDGLFAIIKDYEVNNFNLKSGIINSILTGKSN